MYWIPITHGVLMVFNFITGNPQIGLDGVKSFCTFAGMILNVNLIIQVTGAMLLFPKPFLVNFDAPIG